MMLVTYSQNPAVASYHGPQSHFSYLRHVTVFKLTFIPNFPPKRGDSKRVLWTSEDFLSNFGRYLTFLDLMTQTGIE
jgi:hypothetical protein